MKLKEKIKFFYKYLINNFFFLLYKKPKYLSLDYKTVEIKINHKKKINYNLYKITNGRIFTDTLYNVSYIKNNKIIDKVSIQQDSKKFIINNKFNHTLKIGTPKFVKKFQGPILSLVQGASGHNYYHFLFDILPKILITAKKFNLNYFKFFYLPEFKHKSQKQILSAIGINEKKYIDSSKAKHITSDLIIVPEHPYCNNKKSWFDSYKTLPSWIVTILKKNLLNLKTKIKKVERIYISREDTTNSHNQISNEIDLYQCLKNFKFTKIKLSEYSFFEQISLFNNAKIIVGPHGAGMANLIFCKKKTIFIEIVSDIFSVNVLYKKISSICSLKYIKFNTGKLIKNQMLVNINKIEKQLKSILKKVK